MRTGANKTPVPRSRPRRWGSLAELTGGTFKRARTPSPAKYRHSENPSLTWSGRGRQLSWIKEATEAGTSLDTFLIEPES